METENRTRPFPEGSPVMFVDRYLEKHITPVTLKSNIKKNPLYMDIMSVEAADNEKFKPSWTIKEYDTQTIHGNLADYLKVICEEKWIPDRISGFFLTTAGLLLLIFSLLKLICGTP